MSTPTKHISTIRARIQGIVTFAAGAALGLIYFQLIPTKGWTGWLILLAVIPIVAIAIILLDNQVKSQRYKRIQSRVDFVIGAVAGGFEILIADKHGHGWVNILWVFMGFGLVALIWWLSGYVKKNKEEKD